MTDISFFAADIDHYENSGNFAQFFIKKDYSPELLKQCFADLGITDIIQIKNTEINGTIVSERMVEVKYLFSPQKNEVEDLMKAQIRMKALKDLYSMGGIKPTKSEQDYFKSLEMQVAKMAKDHTW